jgi:hypothetical protein
MAQELTANLIQGERDVAKLKGKKVKFELIGETPLLMHWDNIEGGDDLKAWRQDPANKNVSVPGDDRSPAWTWHTYCYHDGERLAMPADNVMASLLYGGTQVVLKRQKTFKELSQSGLLIGEEHVEFTYGDDQSIAKADLDAIRDKAFVDQSEWAKSRGFRLFVKRAKVGQAKHVRVRPRFETWTVRGEISVLAQEITKDVLQTMFAYAGRGGICDWRPSTPKRPGPYGMFTAKVG